MRALRFATLLTLTLIRTCAQQLTVGAVGGTAITPDFPTTDISNSGTRFQFQSGPRSFIFGAFVEFGLPGAFSAFSIEAGALHRPMKATITYSEFPSGGSPTVSANTATEVRAWEFPLLLKYNLPGTLSSGRFHPFLEAGPSFRTQQDAGAVQPSQFGLSAGAGVTVHLGRVRIAPTLRYTRWDRESIYPKYATRPDQLEFLTSVGYEAAEGTRVPGNRRLELGIVAGFPLSSGFSHGISERTRYLAGITAQVNLLPRFALELDAIYKPLRAAQVAGVQERFSVITWQFPVLAKYRWPRFPWVPFAEAGPSFRLAGNLNSYNPSHYGFTAGGGVEIRVHRILLSPALRYTRWAADTPLYSSYRNFATNASAVESILAASF